MDEHDVFHYCGDDPSAKGMVASSLEIRNHPLKYKVEAFMPDVLPILQRATKKTFYYITWTGFLSEWKRVSVH